MKVLVTGGSGFIGLHLITHLLDCGYEVINVDCAAPEDESRLALWKNCSILDADILRAVFREFQPQFVVHLAAQATVDGRSLDDYRVNTVGTANLLEACKETPSVERVIVTSTQHVRRPGSEQQSSDTDFAPYMFYGQSKVITEELTRSAGLQCAWTIIRPTTVWGPGHFMLAQGLWGLMAQGKYVHPSHDPVLRSYGYVKCVAWQIEKLLQANRDDVHGRVFYVADGNTQQLKWVNAFSQQLAKRDVRTVPVSFIRLLAWIGDGMRAIGLRFPMYSERFQNMVTPNPVPIEPTLELLGTPPILWNREWKRRRRGWRHITLATNSSYSASKLLKISQKRSAIAPMAKVASA
jgi:nucleoside-diphosphate-sugar epimerase